MPGTVVSVEVSDGDDVVAGQTLLVIEAMKMEHRVLAPSDGIVTLMVRPATGCALDQVGGHHHRPPPRRDPGMTYDLTPEQRKLRDEVRDFADTVVAPAAYEYDTKRELPYEIIAQMGEMGLFGLPFPIEYGGQGQDYVELCLAVEQLARVDQSIAVTLEAGVGLGAMPVYRSGTEAQKQEWLPMLAQGKALAGFGLTEADAGFGRRGTKTTAVLEGGEWVINGTKQFITNSGSRITRLVTITAVTGESVREDGSVKKELTAILVPERDPRLHGRSRPTTRSAGTPPTRTRSLRPTSACPRRTCSASAGAASRTSSRRSTRAASRSPRSARVPRRGASRRRMRYAKSRNVFGQPIGENQHIAFKIARMQARVHSARLAWLRRRPPARRRPAVQDWRPASPSSIASEAAMDNARDATQIFGGYGFMNENPVARHYRDSKILEIGEGTTEVQLMIIARELGFARSRGEQVTRDVVQRGLYFEELEPDVRYLHRPGRTVTEADNVLFTTLTMNTQALHLDAAWAATQPFGQRLVNSMFTLVDPRRPLGRPADPGHDRREPGLLRGRVPASAVPRRHPVRRDGGRRQAAVAVAARPGHRDVRAHRPQPGRRGRRDAPPARCSSGAEDAAP